MMARMIGMVLASGLIVMALLMVGPVTFAQQAQGPGQGAGQGQCAGDFVDADGDGVCDNAGQNQGDGPNFVDADGDGVCDHAGQPPRDGSGQGRGGGPRDGSGQGRGGGPRQP
ncbi:MAG: hypothetical protein HC837_04910 [Chloroflexaceae bacterium]|nr:hypothetical protein [Chloroflexaceae bacterium]